MIHMTVLDLSDKPDVRQSITDLFSGVKWAVYRQYTGDTAKAYMQREWGCVMKGDTGYMALEFECDADAVQFMLKRPWEEPLKLSENDYQVHGS